MKIAELFESEEKITPSKVKAAIARADRAELAIEREQSKSGYGRSNDRVRELRSKYSSLRAEANRLEALLKKQQKVDEAVLKDPKSKQSDIKNKTGRNFYEAKEATVKAIKIKIHSTTTDEYIQRFIDDQTEVTVEDWERKGDTLYLYPYFDIEISEPRLIGMQQRLQREF